MSDRRCGPSGRARVPAVVVAVAVASLGLAGCTSSSKASSTTTTAPNRSLTVDTPDGTATLSLDGKLPPNWPSDFPVPTGATPAGSGSIANADNSRQVAVFQSSESGPDAFNFYKNSTTLQVSNARSVGAGNAFVGRLQVSGAQSGSVTVTELNGQTTIVIHLTGATPSTTTTSTAT